MSESAASHVTNGALQAFSSDLTNKVLQTPQAQQALQSTANGIAQSGAAIVATAAAVASTTAATAAVMVAVLPFFVGVGVASYGGYKLWEWLES